MGCTKQDWGGSHLFPGHYIGVHEGQGNAFLFELGAVGLLPLLFRDIAIWAFAVKICRIASIEVDSTVIVVIMIDAVPELETVL